MPDTKPMSVFGPDFPFAYDSWLSHPDGLGQLPAEKHGTSVAIVGAGLSGLVIAYELMRLGLRPILYESAQLGGRLRSQPFEGNPDVIAELGGMRFPESGTSFYHYVYQLGLGLKPFPNPLTAAAGSTLIDIEGRSYYAESEVDLPPVFRDVMAAWDAALEEGARFSDLKQAIRARDAVAVHQIWHPLVRQWDERTFYDFISTSRAFRALTFHHREIFGQVGFGTGGWDSDFPNSMLEILRVNLTECDDNQHLIVGGAEQVPWGLWHRQAKRMAHWPEGTSVASLNRNATRPAVRAISRAPGHRFRVTDRWGHSECFDAVVATCQSWLLTTAIDTEESLFANKTWMALDRTRYMQSSKTFVMVDRPFWKDKDPKTGRDLMSMTLTDRLTRGTYLFDNGPDLPAVICLTYTWMSDALKMLPLPVERRVELALAALAKIYPGVDIAAHIVGEPISVSWEADPNFLGAFKGALPGHYRYNYRMFSHFMQRDLAPEMRGIFLAGDDVSWTPAWAEGAVHTGLNAVWGVLNHLGGHCSPGNPGPGDVFDTRGPLVLDD
ncbi:MAG: FAD-dependent oxidoreductase [Burkholderiaceae bacterium]